ncbi:MAG: hypothetical protein HY744_17240 [Deltaproteobacteria bacterium]|nr:hypothetical protein [Deltaproteobacteria bacterium]
MDDLLDELAGLHAALGAASTDLRLIGGLAVRLHVGEEARRTGDIDLVAMTEEARDALLGTLTARGYLVGTTGQWWRAAPADGSRRFVDVASHPVVDVRTFDRVHLRGTPRQVSVGAARVQLAAATDLALLKLMACRDQDLVDLLLLAASSAMDVREIARSAERDDIERRVAGGAVRARHELARGGLAAAAHQALGRAARDEELRALTAVLRALEQEGL